MKRDAQTKADRAEIAALLNARASAQQSIARLEKALDVEFTRQEECAKKAKMLSDLAGILSVTSAAAVSTEDPGFGPLAQDRIAPMQAERTAAMKQYAEVGSKILAAGARVGKTDKLRLPRVPPGPRPLPRQEPFKLKRPL